MADVERKRVTLHPLTPEGKIDTTVNLYPKTLVNAVVDSEGNAVDIATQDELDTVVQEVQDDINLLSESIGDAQEDIQDLATNKQDVLVNQENIKSINGQSILGSGNIEINSGVWGNITGDINNQEDLQEEFDSKLDFLELNENSTVANLPENGEAVIRYKGTNIYRCTCQRKKNGLFNVKIQGINGMYEVHDVESTYRIADILSDEGAYHSFVIEKTDAHSVPENENSLYRYEIADSETGNTLSSHIVEVVKEEHAGGELTFEKTTTSNNTSLDETAFMSQFSSDLSSYINCISTANVYSLYYSAMEVPFNGIRIGTKNVGTIELNVLQECDVVIYKYFSYNSQTGTKSYDTNAEFIIDGELVYDFDSDDTPVTITLTAGNHTISSGGQNMRVILTAFEVDGESYNTFEKHELARVDELEELANIIEENKQNSDAHFTQVESSITNVENEVTRVDSKIGDIQIYQVVNRLPNPGEQFLNKIFRYNEVLYQCVKRGEGVHKEFVFDVSGTSEIVYGTDGKIYEAFMNEVGNEFKDYYEIPTHEESGEESETTITVLDAIKLFRNNGTIRIGSSSAVGRVTFQSIAELPITSLKVGVKAYRADRPSCIYIEDNVKTYPAQLIENSVEETLISLTYENEGDLDYLRLESQNSYTDTSGDEPVTIQCDNRVIVTRLIVDFGEVSFEWIPVSSGGSGDEMSYEETMNILRGVEQ